MRSGGPPAERRGGIGEVPPEENRGDRGVVSMKYKPISMVLLLLLTKYPTGVSVLWRYQCGAAISSILVDF